MAYWWVNHKRTIRDEIDGNFLWSPRTKKNGKFNQTYHNMTIANAGDVVFSYASGSIKYIGVVSESAFASEKPGFQVSTPWTDDGWTLPVTFVAAQRVVVPKDNLPGIIPKLPVKHSPIRASGDGNQGVYLARISDELGAFLLSLAGDNPELNVLDSTDDSLLPDLSNISKSRAVSETEREQLIRARVGQGLFRLRVLAAEPACRLTGIAVPSLLKASHIKPWRDCSNEQRLDGNNGLMLSPHVDALFDKHLLSFEDDGTVVLSNKIPLDVIDAWNLRSPKIIKSLSYGQRQYMGEHRTRLK